MRWSLFIRPTWSSCTLASELLSLSSSSLLCSCWEAEKKTYIKYIKMCTILKVSLQEDEIYLRRAVWCLAVNLLSWLDWRRLYPSQILHSVINALVCMVHIRHSNHPQTHLHLVLFYWYFIYMCTHVPSLSGLWFESRRSRGSGRGFELASVLTERGLGRGGAVEGLFLSRWVSLRSLMSSSWGVTGNVGDGGSSHTGSSSSLNTGKFLLALLAVLAESQSEASVRSREVLH